MVIAAVMVVMRLATRRARYWWRASALRLVGVVSRLTVVVIKVPAMEVNVAAVVLLKLRETTQLKVRI